MQKIIDFFYAHKDIFLSGPVVGGSIALFIAFLITKTELWTLPSEVYPEWFAQNDSVESKTP